MNNGNILLNLRVQSDPAIYHYNYSHPDPCVRAGESPTPVKKSIQKAGNHSPNKNLFSYTKTLPKKSHNLNLYYFEDDDYLTVHNSPFKDAKPKQKFREISEYKSKLLKTAKKIL
jgi:hypothetical protein